MEDIEQLRKLLLGREREELDDLKRKLDDVPADTDGLARMLPAAVKASHAKNSSLVEALQEPVSDCLSETAKSNPQPLVDALFPVIGPAIRKAIAESLREFSQTINQAIEHSVSPKGLKWRLESLRTGVPFAEIVLQNTLRYRVERVFLVHRESGLLIEHAASDEASGMDSDAVSGMMTALESFVRDSFMNSEDGGRLETIDLGEYTLWIVHGPHTVLACAIRGVGPAELRHRMHDVLEQVHSEYGSALDGFNGDKVALVGVDTYLNRCLWRESDEASEDSKDGAAADDSGPSLIWWLLLAALVIGGVTWWLIGKWTNNQVDQVRLALDATPGIVITGVERGKGAWQISGLRDPLAASPQQVVDSMPDRVVSKSPIAQRVQPTYRFRLQPYYSMEPEILALRNAAPVVAPEPVVVPPPPPPEPKPDPLSLIIEQLSPPETVKVRLDGDLVVLSGSTAWAWLATAESRLAKLPEDYQLKAASLTVNEWSDAKNLVAALGAQQIFFDRGATIQGTPEGTYDRAASLVKRILNLASIMDARFGLVLVGFSDATGSDQLNTAMKIARAEVVRDALVDRGVSSKRIVIQTGASANAAGIDPEYRRVDFVPELVTPPLMKRLQ